MDAREQVQRAVRAAEAAREASARVREALEFASAALHARFGGEVEASVPVRVGERGDMDHDVAKRNEGLGCGAAADAVRASVTAMDPVLRRLAFAKPEEAEKFIADLVVCAIKLASECPSGRIDLEAAVLRRMREKGVLVEQGDRDCG